MGIKKVKLAVKCSRCKELTTTPEYLDGDIPVCKDCLEDLVFDAKFDEYQEEADARKEKELIRKYGFIPAIEDQDEEDISKSEAEARTFTK